MSVQPPPTRPNRSSSSLLFRLWTQTRAERPPSLLDSTSVTAGLVKPKQLAIAARRASHNAVERLRRENLNTRFLDLASLLPDSPISGGPRNQVSVNSCIAHVRASRRHRFLASQKLRALKDECDLLRREANEWRERAGIMLLPTPNRDEIFELILADPLSGEGEDDDYGDKEGGHGARYTWQEDLACLEACRQQAQQQSQYEHAQAHFQAHPAEFQSPFAHNIPPPPSAYSTGVSNHPWHDKHHEDYPSYRIPHTNQSYSTRTCTDFRRKRTISSTCRRRNCSRPSFPRPSTRTIPWHIASFPTASRSSSRTTPRSGSSFIRSPASVFIDKYTIQLNLRLGHEIDSAVGPFKNECGSQRWADDSRVNSSMQRKSGCLGIPREIPTYRPEQSSKSKAADGMTPRKSQNPKLSDEQETDMERGELFDFEGNGRLRERK
ncbi:hypothetical protein B0H13DRAFT_2530004 [Mycena leptocephala]|nr:hypothetical protein B0H13DRAFT_2530004 [Mycena leptocephala]